MTKRFERLAQREQVLAPVVSHQRFGQGRLADLDPPIAEFRQHVRVTLTQLAQACSISGSR